MAPTGAADVSAQRSTNRAADFVIQTLEDERFDRHWTKDGRLLHLPWSGPRGRTVSCGGIDRGAGVVLLEAAGAEVSEGRV